MHEATYMYTTSRLGAHVTLYNEHTSREREGGVGAITGLLAAWCSGGGVCVPGLAQC